MLLKMRKKEKSLSAAIYQMSHTEAFDLVEDKRTWRF